MNLDSLEIAMLLCMPSVGSISPLKTELGNNDIAYSIALSLIKKGLLEGSLNEQGKPYIISLTDSGRRERQKLQSI